jgi:hypothetical protein
LAESHIAAVTIAFLLLGAMVSTVNGIWSLLLPTVNFLSYVVVTLDIPSLSDAISYSNRVDIALKILYLFYALMGLGAASLLSQWVYGVGPIRCLTQYRDRQKNDGHA